MSSSAKKTVSVKLLLDVGNTSTTWGLSHENKIIQKGFVDTHPLTGLGNRIQSQVTQTIEQVWIASVVRGATPVLEKTFGVERIHRILPNTIHGLKNKTLEPDKVGVDRLVNIKAALAALKPPFVILDSGTAITLCVVNRDGEYLGGSILPGLVLSRDVLSEKTSLLPSIEICAPRAAIGRNTEEALLSGIVLATSHAIRGLYQSIKNEIEETELPFIGTGGNIALLAPLIPELSLIDPNLTLKGIEQIAYE